jgi:cell volume regulation protein A
MLPFAETAQTLRHVHPRLEGTLLPFGFFFVLGFVYLTALAVDRLAAKLRLPGAAALLLLGLAISQAMAGIHHVQTIHVETLHRISLALLIFCAGLGTDLRRIRGMVGSGLRLGTVGVLLTLLLTALALRLLGPGLMGDPGGLPLAAAWLAASCLTATDRGAVEDLLRSLHHAIRGRLTHLLEFETGLSTVSSVLCFGFIAGLFHAHGSDHSGATSPDLALEVGAQLAQMGRHVLAGLVAGALVGGPAPKLIDKLVRSEQQLLLVAISLAFLAFGMGQILGGGGLLAVFMAGMWLANGPYRMTRFDQQAIERGAHPFNTAAEFTVLLLLGFLVSPAELLRMLPYGLLLALAMVLIRLVAVGVSLPGAGFKMADRWILACCGLRGAVPLALAVAMGETLPHLQGVSHAMGDDLSSQLLALLFVAVLATLLLQTLGMEIFSRLNPQRAAFGSGES